MKHVLKYKIVAVAEGAVEYNPNAASSYAEALKTVDDIRAKLKSINATVTTDKVRPATVRD